MADGGGGFGFFIGLSSTCPVRTVLVEPVAVVTVVGTGVRGKETPPSLVLPPPPPPLEEEEEEEEGGTGPDLSLD